MATLNPRKGLEVGDMNWRVVMVDKSCSSALYLFQAVFGMVGVSDFTLPFTLFKYTYFPYKDDKSQS